MGDPVAKQDVIVGVDLGGTKILAGVFGPGLKCLATAKLSTKAERGYESVVERIRRCIGDAIDEADLSPRQVRAVGLGAPGAVNPATGEVLFAPNLKWKGVPLGKDLGKLLDLPVFVENDGNVCALGVHAVEMEGKPGSLVGIFLGTGIGAGILLNGELWGGFNGTAGEVGHMVLDVGGPKCGCGNRGCFEALASRTAIFRDLADAIRDGAKSHLVDMLGPGEAITDLKSGDLRKALRKGDKLVEKVVEGAAEYTGIAVGNIINFLNPEVVVLGGGVMDALQDDMMAIIEATARDYAMTGTSEGIRVVSSKLGDKAGITGAAVLARRGLKA